jgi:hypothetical protein
MYDTQTKPCLRSGSHSLAEMYRVLFRNAKTFTEKLHYKKIRLTHTDVGNIYCTNNVHVQGQVMVGYISSSSKPART